MYKFCIDMFSVLVGIYLGMELLGYMVTVQQFEELLNCFTMQLHHLTFLLIMYKDYNFSTFLLVIFFIIVILVNVKYVMVVFNELIFN